MTDVPNATQATYWAGPSGTSWITHQDDMDALLRSVNQALLKRAGNVNGLDVLDIGCGTGALSLDFAAAGASVTASDISKPLLEKTAERGKGLIETLLADAQTTIWDKSFDLVVSRFGVMFFEEPAHAFANIAKALKPGGRALFATWGPFDENPWWHMPQSIAANAFGITPTPSDPHAPGPMGMSDKDWSLAQMESPAWQDVGCEAVDVTLDYPKGAVAAGTLATFVGPAARVLNLHEATEDVRKEVARRISDTLNTYETVQTVRIPARLHFYSAIRA